MSSSLGESEFEQPGPSNFVDNARDDVAVELRKDGTVSKMRSHKGNIPSVPQTKACPLCPAKFTRTTHLSRHIRTHTRDKMHECDKCHSQFTRSDLLTRHKRTCGDMGGMSRSRRKSCQSCAASKIKCDLQQPCSKCKTRGRDCVYVTSRPAASSHTSSATTDGDSPEDLEAKLLAFLESHDRSTSTVSLPQSYMDILRPTAEGDARCDDAFTSPFAMPKAPGSVNFSIESSAMFARIDHALPAPQDEMSDQLLSNDMFDGFFDGVFAPDQQMTYCPPSTSCPPEASTTVSSQVGMADMKPMLDYHFPLTYTDMPEMTFLQNSPMESTPTADHSTPWTDATTPAPASANPSARPSAQSALDLQTYQSLFFTAYLPNMPLVHVPTFRAEGKCSILLAAMQACGALYVKTRTAMNFIDSVLSRARDELVAEFARESLDWDHQVHLALAVDLFQTVGLFHQTPEQRAFSNVYHGMLTMMIRFSGFAEKVLNWVPPESVDASSADRVWSEWVKHETAKRALTVSYLHDSCHCIYFNLRPTYVTSEFDMCLPCEDALWTAPTAEAWLALLQQPSPYGSMSERLCGRRLQATYAKLTDAADFAAPLMLNPWAHNVVIHMILRQLFEEFLEARMPAGGNGSGASVGAAAVQGGGCISPERIFSLQLALHQWLQSWMHSPDTPAYDELEPRFMDQALPYYWIAQVALLAHQERLPPFCAGTTFLVSGEAKYRLMKKWERHIRNFLRKGGKEPTLFLDELVKVHLLKWQAQTVAGEGAGQDEEDESVNLLGFFPET
ncbi:hypothetical protein WOLCODRAFT_138453 [Wolfiporia cocos MD-104 SS10]|uniref:Zn(2)-C6 fungal-type domain-containing protein n=1 Tax=Wolfiporia cocos (strain MD-104) TaxID=742152 RepID=A0A2H3K589_WOLCO|nr:hypothetical protein WOLCODRAFT_138453 [Wolfiporia cocos MD-104 SS10]